VDITFDTTANDSVSSQDITAQYAQALENGKVKSLVSIGNVSEAQSENTKQIEREYNVPFLAHATLEPMSALAWVRDGKCDLYTGTQNPLGTRMITAKTLDTNQADMVARRRYGARSLPPVRDGAYARCVGRGRLPAVLGKPFRA